MSLYTVTTMEAMIRAVLDEPSQARITSTQILHVLNDGLKEVAIKALCIERETEVAIMAGERVIPFDGIKVNFVRSASLFGTVAPIGESISLTVPGVPTVAVSTLVTGP